MTKLKCAMCNVQVETSTCGNGGKTVRNLRIEKIGKRLDDWGDHTQGCDLTVWGKKRGLVKKFD
jgi:hypothetical protein